MSYCNSLLLLYHHHHHFLFLSRPKSPNLPVIHKNPSTFSPPRRIDHHLIPRAASAPAPLSGSPAADQLLGGEVKQKRRKIAGIDQDELVDPSVLADQDSCFCEFKGVQIHHKICDAEPDSQNTLTKRLDIPMILLHGFGASLFSWHRVMKSLTNVTGSKVLAFDRPAFGLTSRGTPSKQSSSESTKPLNPYSIMFSVLATLFFIDFLEAKKAILVGHSAGSLVAVETYFEAPERVAALILVAPAIVAPLIPQKTVEENQEVQDDSNSAVTENPVLRIGNSLLKLSRYIAEAIMHLFKGMVDMISSLYKKALSAFLRTSLAAMLVRMVIDKFGIAAVRNSWYDPNQIGDHVIQGYTKPLRIKGWDRALLDFVAAMLTESASESKPSLPKRLSEISCPVLIVTGDSDRLVPSWNAERLSRFIPGACFEVIKNCGHLPQEEKPEEFLSIVDRFLQRKFGGIQVPPLQAAM